MRDTESMQTTVDADEQIEQDDEQIADGDEHIDADEQEVDTSHLDDVDDGCGCAEVWEHLSEERDE